jgi:hypothetical protein
VHELTAKASATHESSKQAFVNDNKTPQPLIDRARELASFGPEEIHQQRVTEFEKLQVFF